MDAAFEVWGIEGDHWGRYLNKLGGGLVSYIFMFTPYVGWEIIQFDDCIFFKGVGKNHQPEIRWQINPCPPKKTTGWLVKPILVKRV